MQHLRMAGLISVLCVAPAACTVVNPAYRADDASVDGAGRPVGTIGGPCYPNDTCNSGLKCAGGICVPIHDGGWWDGPRSDGPQLPDSATSCASGIKKTSRHSEPTGDWSVILEHKTTYKLLTIAQAKPMSAAAALDYNEGKTQAAGFVISRASVHGDVNSELSAAVLALGKAVSGSVTSRSGGTKTMTHDGFPLIALATVDIQLGSQSTVSAMRNILVASLLKVPYKNLSGFSKSFGGAKQQHVIRLAVALRSGGRTVFIGAVTDKASDDDASRASSIVSRDLASATGLARAGKSMVLICDNQTVTTTPQNAVDIIWVIDESGSMSTKRNNIAVNAASFFSQAKQQGLDFRMGVTNVCNPGGAYKSAVGKLCSSTSSDPTHSGGADRFLLPTEEVIFSACIQNPPGHEQGAEYGLVNAEEAVRRHLPRAANQPDKLRTGAQVVIIVVTDEGPQSLKAVIPSNEFKKCTLGAASQAKVNGAVKPHIDYLSGAADPGAKIDHFQVIGGICSSAGCRTPPEVAHGYKELAQAFNGTVYDVCQANLTNSVKTIIGKILAAASPVQVSFVPIGASLQVSLDGKKLVRSMVNGFMHTPLTRRLSFLGSAKIVKGSVVSASYQLWK